MVWKKKEVTRYIRMGSQSCTVLKMYCSFFQDNDVIGKIVKCADLYMLDHAYCEVGDSYFNYFDSGINGLERKMVFYAECCPTYFVCQFTDDTCLIVDYSADDGGYLWYGNDLTFPDGDIRYVSPAFYGNVFDHLKGEKLEGITISSHAHVSKRGSEVSSCFLLQELCLDFVNSEYSDIFSEKPYVFYNAENESHRDSVGFDAIWPEYPVISFFTDRDIPGVEKKHIPGKFHYVNRHRRTGTYE